VGLRAGVLSRDSRTSEESQSIAKDYLHYAIKCYQHLALVKSLSRSRRAAKRERAVGSVDATDVKKHEAAKRQYELPLSDTVHPFQAVLRQLERLRFVSRL